MPKTPSPDRPDLTSMLGHVATASEASTSNHPSFAVSEGQAANAEHGTDPSSSDSEGSDAMWGQFDWLKEATDALGELHEFIATD